MVFCDSGLKKGFEELFERKKTKKKRTSKFQLFYNEHEDEDEDEDTTRMVFVYVE